MTDKIKKKFDNDEGNFISKISPAFDRAWTYRYDHRNRLTHVDKREALDTTLVVEFEYDLFNRRIAKRVERPNAPAENYSRTMFYNGEMIWSEETKTASDTVTTRYLTGQFIDQWIARQTSTSGLQPPASGPTWFLTDRMGTPYAIADAEGNVLESYTYTAFGGQTIHQSSLNLHASTIGFTGRESDPETGLMYYRARYYDPAMGRFISEDPIGFAASYHNLFAGMENALEMFIDPFGQNNMTESQIVSLWTRQVGLCLRSLGLHLAQEYTLTMIYMFFAGYAGRVGQTTRGAKRIKEWQSVYPEAKKLIEESWTAVYIASGGGSDVQAKIRQAEQYGKELARHLYGERIVSGNERGFRNKKWPNLKTAFGDLCEVIF
jgi:RHS repeat-associated protein